ncbi:MAG: hemolysin III family protein [Thermaerobacter sp.]|nr:hemolysin III family protein [Thermaerobacter sp.]
MNKKPDWISGISHGVGAVMSVVGLFFLTRSALTEGTVRHLISFSIFGGSLVLLYAASAFYHLVPARERVHLWLRRLDHMMVFVLIAGTYTPFCLLALRGVWGTTLLIAVWSLSIVGIVLKVVWLFAPRWVYTGFYLLLGWLIVIAAGPLWRALPLPALGWLGMGGLFYTVGAFIYGLKWPKLIPNVFGFHELWHLFVMAGSFAHYWAVFRFLPHVG